MLHESAAGTGPWERRGQSGGARGREGSGSSLRVSQGGGSPRVGEGGGSRRQGRAEAMNQVIGTWRHVHVHVHQDAHSMTVPFG